MPVISNYIPLLITHLLIHKHNVHFHPVARTLQDHSRMADPCRAVAVHADARFRTRGLDLQTGCVLRCCDLFCAFHRRCQIRTDFIVSNDKIYFSSNYGYKIAENLYVGALLTFNSQFAKGYDYKVSDTDYISRFMAPGYLTTGVGLIWTPRTWLKITFNPASWRATFVNDDYLSNLPGGSYGVPQGEHMLNQFGANLVAEVTKNIWENVNLYSRLELYSNYLDKPQNIIVHWDTQLNFKINRWLSAGLNFNLIYDDNIKFNDGQGRMIPKLQVKETLGIGLQIQF
mgnify:CR=1 FL=1